LNSFVLPPMPRSAVPLKMAPKLRLKAFAKRVTAKKDGKAPSTIKGLRGFRSLSGTFSDRVDRGVSQQNAALASRATVLPGLNARLVSINPAENSDKYYVLQGLEDPRIPAKRSKRFYAYQRWGRTGTGGTCRLQGPMEQSKLEAHLFKVFKSKTGASWGSLKPGEKAKPGKYWLANPSIDCIDEFAVWQYRVDDGVDQKRSGWYPYDAEGVAQVEELHAEHEANKSSTNSTSRRFVDSGSFTYCIDFDALTQSNVATGTTRPIRRVLGGSSSSVSPPRSPSRVPVAATARAGRAASCRSGHVSRMATGLSASDALHGLDSMETIPATPGQVEAARDAQSKPANRSDSPAVKKRSFADMLVGSTFTQDTLPTISSPKRCCREETSQGTRPSLPHSFQGMRHLVFSGELRKLSHPELKSFLHSHGVAATGDKNDLLERVSSLAMSVTYD